MMAGLINLTDFLVSSLGLSFEPKVPTVALVHKYILIQSLVPTDRHRMHTDERRVFTA